ncbi:hypothetical protein [Fulvivirga ligni]|uniref:hypothetical protein n=1 Tax=Fulvivirga ligni TaxID=2904246 RepID=UPI001F24CBEE|nr:hypothetical protein [Fulvivirga ligni]UII20920.1 hypothetical protein LVD16_24050 [Fulvivirga ligni]
MRVSEVFDSLTDKWSKEKDDEFWFEMEKHEDDWNILREKSKAALKLLISDELTVEVKHANELDEKGNIVIQRTETKLKEK